MTRDLLCKYDSNVVLSPAVCDFLDGPDATARFRSRHVELIDVGIPLRFRGHPDFCFRHPQQRWSREEASAADTPRRISSAARSRHSATLFDLFVWIGDEFCIGLALATGADGSRLLDLVDRAYEGSRPDDVAEPKLFVDLITQSTTVKRFIVGQRWSLNLASGAEIKTTDCSNDSLLGEGECSRVFRTSFRHKPCALKVFKHGFGSLSAAGLQALLNELAILTRVQSPFIVQCFGFFVHDIRYPTLSPCSLLELMDVSVGELLAVANCTDLHCVSERLVGLSLSDMAQTALTNLQPRLQIATDVAKGLAYLHSRTPPVLHRDVRPGNILLRFQRGADDSFSFVSKLSDFCLSETASWARAGTEASTTSTRSMDATSALTTVGATQTFMAPEQWTHTHRPSSKADMFSFGLSVFCIVCCTETPWVLESPAPTSPRIMLRDSDIRTRMDNRHWPVWPKRVPDASVDNGGSIPTPAFLVDFTSCIFNERPTHRVSAEVAAAWLHNQRRPAGAVEVPKSEQLTMAPTHAGILDSAAGYFRGGTEPISFLTPLSECRDSKAFVDSLVAKFGRPLVDYGVLQNAATLGEVAECFAWSQAALDRAAPPLLSPQFALPPFLEIIRYVDDASSILQCIHLMQHVGPEVNYPTIRMALRKCRRRLERMKASWTAFAEAAAGGGNGDPIGAEAPVGVETMSDDSLLAILLYTAACPDLYSTLNHALREHNGRKLLYFLPYLRLLISALRQFAAASPARCRKRTLLFRGTSTPASKLNPPHVQDSSVVYWSLSSATDANTVPRDMGFLGSAGAGTYFQIHDCVGVDISEMTMVEAEREVLLLPGAQFRVLDVYRPQPQRDYTHITLRQVEHFDDVGYDNMDRTGSPQPLSTDMVVQPPIARLMSLCPQVTCIGPRHMSVKWEWGGISQVVTRVSVATIATTRGRWGEEVLGPTRVLHVPDTLWKHGTDVCPEKVEIVVTPNGVVSPALFAELARDGGRSEDDIVNGHAAYELNKLSGPWVLQSETCLNPDTEYSVQLVVEVVRAGPDGDLALELPQYYSYPAFVHTPPTIPARPLILESSLLHLRGSAVPRVRVRFRSVYFVETEGARGGGKHGNSIHEVALLAFKPDCDGALAFAGHVACQPPNAEDNLAWNGAVVWLPTSADDVARGVREISVAVPPAWRGHQCFFEVALRSNAGWSIGVDPDSLSTQSAQAAPLLPPDREIDAEPSTPRACRVAALTVASALRLAADTKAEHSMYVPAAGQVVQLSGSDKKRLMRSMRGSMFSSKLRTVLHDLNLHKRSILVDFQTSQQPTAASLRDLAESTVGADHSERLLALCACGSTKPCGVSIDQFCETQRWSSLLPTLKSSALVRTILETISPAALRVIEARALETMNIQTHRHLPRTTTADPTTIIKAVKRIDEDAAYALAIVSSPLCSDCEVVGIFNAANVALGTVWSGEPPDLIAHHSQPKSDSSVGHANNTQYLSMSHSLR